MSDQQEMGESDARFLRRTLWRRTVEPARHFPFLVFVFLAILLFGGLGIWIEILKIVLSPKPTYEGLITASITFFPTLIGSTALQLVLASATKGDKNLISFGLLVLCIFLTFAILLPFFSTHHPVRVLTLCLLCSVFSIWIWWITNGLDETFRRIAPENAATGGPVQRPLPGNVSGYEL